MHFQIAAIACYIDCWDCSDELWDQFLFSEEKANADIMITRQSTNTLLINNGSYVHLGFPVEHLMVYDDNLVAVNTDWSKAALIHSSSEAQTELFLLQLFYTHAIRRQMLQLHCSIVDDHGRGILFLGPSGIGKTTQAEKWAEYRGSSIINGDVGFVQWTPEGQIAWGTPWHGSSPYCLNASVPVKALVVLKQAPFNALRELSGFEKVSEVSGSVFYPTWLPDGIETAAGLFDRLLTDLPVYRLDNRADREGVELLARELDRIS